MTRDPFRILIAEVLLQRTRADSVAPVYAEVFRRWPSRRRLALARVDSVASVIRPLGLAYRASRLVALARTVTQIGAVPRDPELLSKFPGVGRYVAHATVAAAFGLPVPAVDRVSARVYRRYFGRPDSLLPAQDRELWALVEKVTPRVSVREWNWTVLDLAAALCTSRTPKCRDCPLRARCLYAAGVPPMST